MRDKSVGITAGLGLGLFAAATTAFLFHLIDEFVYLASILPVMLFFLIHATVGSR